MIYVCNLHEMPSHVQALGPTHLVSLVAPGEMPPTPAGIELERHLRIEIHDISEPLDGHVLPEAEHLAEVIDFLRAWSHDDGALLVHCVAGISRSMAVALIALVIKAGGRELEAAQALRKAAPHAWPNTRIIALADQILGCRGAPGRGARGDGAGELTLPTPLVRLPLLD